MSAQHQYVDLMVSLPHLRNPFISERTPISRVQLASRMSVLLPEHRQLLNDVTRTLYWGQLRSEVTEEELIRRVEVVRRQIEGSLIWEWMQWRLDVRFLMAALRLRRDDVEAPDPALFGAYSRFALPVERNWGHPSFHLEGRFPWLVDVARYLAEQDALALEKTLMGEVWRYYTNQQHKVRYGVEAVFLYMARWDLVDRWTGYRVALARKRFEALVQHSLDSARATLAEEGHI